MTFLQKWKNLWGKLWVVNTLSVIFAIIFVAPFEPTLNPGLELREPDAYVSIMVFFVYQFIMLFSLPITAVVVSLFPLYMWKRVAIIGSLSLTIIILIYIFFFSEIPSLWAGMGTFVLLVFYPTTVLISVLWSYKVLKEKVTKSHIVPNSEAEKE